MNYDNLQFGADYKCKIQNKDSGAMAFVTLKYVDVADNCWQAAGGGGLDECYVVLSADLDKA